MKLSVEHFIAFTFFSVFLLEGSRHLGYLITEMMFSYRGFNYFRFWFIKRLIVLPLFSSYIMGWKPQFFTVKRVNVVFAAILGVGLMLVATNIGISQNHRLLDSAWGVISLLEWSLMIVVAFNVIARRTHDVHKSLYVAVFLTYIASQMYEIPVLMGRGDVDFLLRATMQPSYPFFFTTEVLAAPFVIHFFRSQHFHVDRLIIVASVVWMAWNLVYFLAGMHRIYYWNSWFPRLPTVAYFCLFCSRLKPD